MKPIALLFAASALAAVPAAAQTAPKGSELTLYSAANLKGQKRVIAETMPDLSGADADNFAWSLTTRGRWEVCMDAGHRAGCRVVQGDVRDLGSDGGAITSVRYLGAPGSVRPATANNRPGTVPATGTPPATTGAPAAPAAAPVTGLTYSSTFGKMAITQWGPTAFTGTYEHGEGRLIGTVSGDTVSGIWLQDSSDMPCATKQHGSPYWGRFTFRFEPDRSEFAGEWDWCAHPPGDRASNGVRSSGATTGDASAPATGSAMAQAPAAADHALGAAKRVADRAASGAEEVIGDKVKDAVRRKFGKILGD